MVQLPVCSPDRAFQSWDTSSIKSSPFYPCDIPPGRNHCGGLTFNSQGSDVSPTVSNCQQLIRNIEGDATTDWTHGIVGQRTIASYGSCRSASNARAARAAPSDSGSEARTLLT